MGGGSLTVVLYALAGMAALAVLAGAFLGFMWLLHTVLNAQDAG